MRRLISLFLIIILMFSLSACRVQEAPQDDVTPPVSTTPEVKDNIEFHEQAEKMTVDEAESYLETDKAEETSAQYKEAVYTVNQNLAASYIAESKESNSATEKTKKLFDGICFKFVEGEGYTSQTVKNGLLRFGTYEKSEDGWYRFVFWDRTLAQASANPDNNRTLDEYTNALELLLSDPNVIVKPIED